VKGDSHRADIEGLRGLAVLLVVAFHAGVERLPLAHGVAIGGGGFVGVDVFFVLSGFLIVGKLVEERAATGRVCLTQFYRRRIRRLLPAGTATLVLTLLAVAIFLPRVDWIDAASDGTTAALFVANLRFGSLSGRYLAEGIGASPFLQFWSLGIEEQFYLFFPPLLLLACRRASEPQRRCLWLCGGVAASSLVVSIALTAEGSPWAYYGTLSRVWEIAVGGVVACVRRPVLQWRFWSLTAAVGAAAVGASALLFTRLTPFPGIAALLPVAGTAAILVAGDRAPDAAVPRLLALPPLTFIGRISYSWYLLHWPFLALSGPATWRETPSSGVVAIAVASSFVSALALYVLVEGPMRRRPALAAGNNPFFLLFVGWLAVAAISSVMWKAARKPEGRAERALAARLDVPVLLPRGCEADYFDREAKPCLLGTSNSLPVVVLIGDSHAAHLAPAFDEALRALQLTGWLYTKASCPPFDVRRFLPAYNREYFECDEWRHDVFLQLAAVRPEVVYFARHGNYAATVLAGEDPAGGQAVETWRVGVEQTILEVATNVVLIRDTPLVGFDVPRCEARGSSCVLPMESVRWDSALHQAELDALVDVGLSDEAVFDVNDAICPVGVPCLSVDARGRIKFRDANHLTATYARTLAPDVHADVVRRMTQ
jgi:peptidoglycan/LPS O-acetylase OafA/YrhL